jgi:hypothetical protein
MRKHPNSHREAKATAPVLDSTPVSNNVGAVKHFFERTAPCTPKSAPFRSRGSFCFCSTNQGSLVIKVQVRKLGPTHPSLRSHFRS